MPPLLEPCTQPYGQPASRPYRNTVAGSNGSCCRVLKPSNHRATGVHATRARWALIARYMYRALFLAPCAGAATRSSATPAPSKTATAKPWTAKTCARTRTRLSWCRCVPSQTPLGLLPMSFVQVDCRLATSAPALAFPALLGLLCVDVALALVRGATRAWLSHGVPTMRVVPFTMSSVQYLHNLNLTAVP